MSRQALWRAPCPVAVVRADASTRLGLRRHLGWQGHPSVVLRVGRAAADLGVPAAHRRGADDTVEIDGPRT